MSPGAQARFGVQRAWRVQPGLQLSLADPTDQVWVGPDRTLRYKARLCSTYTEKLTVW